MAAMEHRRTWISMGDGVRLAARLWLPDEQPAAAVLEALPYRMDDLTSSYSSEYERLCQEGGFAVARVDLRGTGSSGGIAVDEYPRQEQEDLVRVIAWLAEQDWCSGRVGMYGTSYSGFNSLQLAAERPPALQAVCAIYASDDRYTDDVHYTGGALRALDLLDYVMYMSALVTLPPVPSVYGEGWRAEWNRRFDAHEPWILRWLEEQWDGTYWRQGSLRPEYGRISCATMLVAGWADGYRNNTFRSFEALTCPKHLLIGPWSHMSPSSSLPGPHIDLVPELIRWFGRWLRDERNGIDDEPAIRVFIRRSTRPRADLAELRGEWRYEATWPPERLARRTLRPPKEGAEELDLRGDVGTAAWISCAARLPWGQPTDQREDDARSLTHEWPLAEELEILGHASVEVTVETGVPVAYLSAKLCDVFPDGTSALVTRGLLNLTHRESSTAPEPLEAEVATEIRIELEATSWVFERGHRIRLALAGADWPNIWPPPSRATARIQGIALELPVVEGTPPVGGRPRFAAPKGDAHTPETSDPQPPVAWQVVRDVLGRELRAEIAHGARYGAEFDARVSEDYEGAVGVSADNPGTAWAKARTRYRIVWPEATCTTETQLELRSDDQAYHLAVDLAAQEDGAPVRKRRWERVIPRRLQ
jgi:putative CocE/NonD family hydrolase